MIVQGIVSKTFDDKALVIVDCDEICLGCQCCRKEDNLSYVEAINNMEAKTQDRVLVWLDTKGFIKSIFFVFLVPTFLFLLDIICVALIFKQSSLTSFRKDLTSFASAMFILMLYFIFVARFHKHFFIPSRITQIL